MDYIKLDKQIGQLTTTLMQYDLNHLKQLLDWFGYDLTMIKPVRSKLRAVKFIVAYHVNQSWGNHTVTRRKYAKYKLSPALFKTGEYYRSRRVTDYIDGLPIDFFK